MCTDPKGYPDATMLALLYQLPAADILALEHVSRHRRLEISAVEQIKIKYLPKPK